MKKLLGLFTRSTQEAVTAQEALFEACVAGDFEKFQQALKEGADLNAIITDEVVEERFGNNATTALVLVAYYDSCQGHEDIFDYILAQPDVNLKAVDKNGNSAIVSSVYKKRPDRVHKIEAALERQEKAAQKKGKLPINPYVPK